MTGYGGKCSIDRSAPCYDRPRQGTRNEGGSALIADRTVDPSFDWFAPEAIPDEDVTFLGAPFWAWRDAQQTRTPESVITLARRDDPRWSVRSDEFIPPQGTKVPYETPSERDRLIGYRLRIERSGTCEACGRPVLRAWDWKRQSLRLVEEVRNTGKFLLREGLLSYWGPTGGPIGQHRCPGGQKGLFDG